MKLYLLRHATAEDGASGAADLHRALTARGRREASGVGSWLAGRDEPPGWVLCSSARRAVETMEHVVAGLTAKPGTSVSGDLYLASAWKLFERMRALEVPDVSSLLVVAHNPGIAELAATLSERGDPAAIRSVTHRFLPASLAEIELPAESLRAAEPQGGTLIGHYTSQSVV